MKTLFEQKHIGISEAQRQHMLQAIGEPSVEALISKTIPSAIRTRQKIDLPEPMSEDEYLTHITQMGLKNEQFKNFIGQGYYDTHLPAVIQRNILENPSWYTPYTPYQAELAQGRLEALLNFQTMVIELTGMDIANASLLDEATAAAEAMNMLYVHRPRTKKEANVFLVSSKVYPQTLDVLKTRASPRGIELRVTHEGLWNVGADDVFGVLLQYPNSHGQIEDYSALIKSCQSHEVQTAVATDLLALTLLTPPGHWGADVVMGNAQRFGIPMGYGGPHPAFFATRAVYKRKVPGRIIGVSKDKHGRPALRMALQTREQHIKRDRATSNICTAQALLASMAGMYAVWHGCKGLQNIAKRVHHLTEKTRFVLTALGYDMETGNCFDTFTVYADVEKIFRIRELAEQNQFNFYYGKKTIRIAFGETHTLADAQTIVDIFANIAEKPTKTLATFPFNAHEDNLPLRQDPFLEQDVFQSYASETEIMRYMKRLERKDLALNHAMIPLGSCTMKLNAAAQMLPISQPQWYNLHPFAPKAQAQGYLQIIKRMEDLLSKLTGFSATSLQPNSGAQGEFAGLMAIRAYHHQRGDTQRDTVLIPSSAHGTNPASAVMAGWRVIIIQCDQNGNIDVNDLFEKAKTHADRLAALMITYPSTHGIFETDILRITQKIHQHGGQVYMDGANMNAQIALTSPAMIGADVCHLNLHKTFAIPHGGGGPGHWSHLCG